jgi:hypothetical protein
MRRTNQPISLLAALLALLWLGGCSTDDIPSVSSEDTIDVPLSISEEGLSITRALGDATPSVNRILILPFKKINELLPTNDATNFAPVYNSARQIDVNSFPYTSRMLSLSATSTYQVMVIGYNRNDYDFANPSSITRHFDIGLSGLPATLADMALKLTSVSNVPEFFTCMANGYNHSILVGGAFKPGLIDNIQGNLTRLSSGLTLDIVNIPTTVTSVSLRAEQLVTAISAADGTPLQWQTAGDASVKLLGTLTPVSGRVTFNTFILPTLDAHKTLLYVDVSFGSSTERYTVKIATTSGVVSGNRIIFTPNHWVKITGDYSSMNLGFVLSGNINLDDDRWDGLHND